VSGSYDLGLKPRCKNRRHHDIREHILTWAGQLRRHGLLLCLILLPCVSVGADPLMSVQPPGARWTSQADTPFRHIGSPEMLFSSSIEQDGQGFIWMGSQDGLVRWDGYSARVYHADPHDKTALSGNYILSLHIDQQGRLWIGTSTDGLSRYDPQRDGFVNIGAGAGGLSNPSVSAIAADGSSGLWIGTGKGLDHLDLATGVVRGEVLGGSNLGAVKAVLQDNDGALWLGTENGLVRRSPGSDRFLSVSLDESRNSAMHVSVLFRDSDGRLWIGTRPYGVYVIEPGQIRAHAIREIGVPSRLEQDTVLNIIEAKKGEIWIGTSGGGIVVVDTLDGWRTKRLRHNPDVPTSLQDDVVTAMYRDRSGLIWVSTEMATHLYDTRQQSLLTLFGSPIGGATISSSQVPFVLSAADGRVWLGLNDGDGIDILDPVAGRVGSLRPDATRPESALPLGRVLAMVATPNRDVYIGTRQGLYLADPEGRQVARIDIPGRASDAAVWSLCLDGNILWLGGLDGLWALDISRAGAPLIARHETAERMGSARVTVLLRAAHNTLWVGTSRGLLRVDVNSDTVEPVPADAANPTGFMAGYMTDLLIDPQGRLWVASVGSGIQVLEGSSGQGRYRFRRLGTREGLPHSGVDKLLTDEQGIIWASTDNGLASIDPRTFEIRVSGSAQGSWIKQNWSNSGARTASGELLFGGRGGITVVRPEQTTRSSYGPPVVVTELRAGSNTLLASRFNGPGAARSIEIPARDRSLMVEFAALDYAAPEENHYAYRLKGFDSDWITTLSTRRLAKYTNLPPGHYTLQLRGSAHEPPWTPSVLELGVTVLPAWYQTSWFNLLAGLLALVLVTALVNARTAFLRRRQLELQKLVAQRTAELQQRTTELEQRTIELGESQQLLQRMAYLDPLTGLANRRRFEAYLRQAASQAARETLRFTLLLIDLDGFKQVNDTLGHDAGDALLSEVSRRLEGVLRKADVIARLGGDEFAVLLADTVGPGAVKTACERIGRALATPLVYRGSTLTCTASIGAARCPEDAAVPDLLYKRADTALYKSKRAGRNTWRWYEQPKIAGDHSLPAESAASNSA
jgi:diguanylate cyclase (GGDEF)-like protein